MVTKWDLIYGFEINAVKPGWIYLRVKRIFKNYYLLYFTTLIFFLFNKLSRCLVYCSDTYLSDIASQFNLVNSQFFIGHDFLFYVYLRKGYQIVEMAPPINASENSFLSFMQLSSGAEIGQYMTGETVDFDSNNTFSPKTDWYWDTVTNTWTQKYELSGSQYNGMANYVRLVNVTSTLIIQQTETTIVQYMYTGNFNVTATIPDTGQVAVCPVTVTLGKFVFY